MTLEEAFTDVPTRCKGPAVRQMLETADRCLTNQTRRVVQFTIPSTPTMRLIFHTLFNVEKSPGGKVPFLTLKLEREASDALQRLRHLYAEHAH
jgi:hypothetical protein